VGLRMSRVGHGLQAVPRVRAGLKTGPYNL
jgi:hypothetical protein